MKNSMPKAISQAPYWLHIVIGVCVLSSCTPVAEPKVNINPEPKVSYTVRLKFEPNRRIDGVVVREKYEIADDRCLPKDYTRSLGGSRPLLYQTFVSNTLERKDLFEAAISNNRILPEDYYGLGECIWSLSIVLIDFNYVSKMYGAVVFREDLDREIPIALYCRSNNSPINWCTKNATQSNVLLTIDINKE